VTTRPHARQHSSRDWWTDTIAGRVTIVVVVIVPALLLGGAVCHATGYFSNREALPEHDIENAAEVADNANDAPLVVHPGRWIRVDDEHIGKGSFAVVYRAWSDDIVKRFAVKELSLKVYLGRDGNSITDTMDSKRNAGLDRIVIELRLLRELRHPNILEHYGEELSISKKKLYIFTELMMAGTIKDRLDKGDVIPNHLVTRFGNDILAGLKYLHHHDPPLVHRDIKPSNLLIDHNGRIKLADFGTVKILDSVTDHTSNYYAGTFLFAPPEMHRTHMPITTAFDVWSLGVTLHMMLTCRSPWPEQYITNNREIFLNYIRRKLPREGLTLDNPILSENVNAGMLTEMILEMLAIAPGDRPTVEEIQDFPFFKMSYTGTETPLVHTQGAVQRLTELKNRDEWGLTNTAQTIIGTTESEPKAIATRSDAMSGESHAPVYDGGSSISDSWDGTYTDYDNR